MIGSKPAPEIRIALVPYRDRGDEYVTKVFDLTEDIDAVYANLKTFTADGGGDGPESVNEALADAVRKISWSQDRDVLKIVFLVGDYPPHMDYSDGPKYKDVCQEAVKKDLIINTVQCGDYALTTPIWQEIARLSEGTFVAIGQTGNMVVTATPMDDELRKLNAEVGKTIIPYGDEKVRASTAAKQVASEAAEPAVTASRLSFNDKSGKTVQGTDELIDNINSGKLKLEAVDKKNLPVELQKLSDADLKARVEQQQATRAALQGQIKELSVKRDAFIEAEEKRLAASGRADSFDAKVAETIREQAQRKNFKFEEPK
jgi:hypothetical protein